MVIAPTLQARIIGPDLDAWRPSKLGSPDDNRLVQHAPLFQVFQQRGDRLIHAGSQFAVIFLEIGVRVPAVIFGSHAAVKDLDKPNTALDQSPGSQTDL